MKKAFSKSMAWLLSVVLVLGLCINSNVVYLSVNAEGAIYWPLPTDKNITRGYSSSHDGADFACASGTPIYATFDGTAVYYQAYTTISGTKYLTSYGNCVYLTSSDGRYWAVFAHMSSFEGFGLQIPSSQTKQQSGSSGKITIGSKNVLEGDILGYVGTTGNSTGNHLHFGLKDNGNVVNPASYLNQSQSAYEHGKKKYIDIGTNFYAYIINNGAWKMATVRSDDVKLYPETAVRDQIWYFERQDDKSYKITNIQTGKCLDVEAAGDSDGSNVHVWSSTDANNQRWYFSGVSGDCYIIPKNAPDKTLDLAGGATGDGTNIQIWTQNGTAAQKFHIWKFDNKPNKPTVTSSSDKYAVGSNVKVSWGENAFATSYWVDVWHNGQHTESFGINDISYTVKNVTAGDYTVFVASCNPNGASETSSVTFNVPTYTISYNMNGGSGSIGNQTKTYGQDLTLSSTKPTRTGYDFVNWNTKSDGTGTNYNPNGKYTANSGATLYAIWKAKQVTVTFYRNQNSSDNTTATQTFTYGASGQSFSNKNWSKDGHTLLGWSENRSATDKQYSTNSSVDPNWIIQKSPKISLYAIWKANTYTITYNMNGGSGSIGNQTKTYGQDLTLSSIKPTRTGYDFVGWNTNKDATTAQYQPGVKYTANSGATLYAIWKANTYTISYNANGGTGTMNSSTIQIGQTLTVANCSFTKTGYSFAGYNVCRKSDNKWYAGDKGWLTESEITNGNYGKKVYGESSTWSFDNTWTNGASTNDTFTFYAIWKANSYTIAYDANGGNGSVGSVTVSFGNSFNLPGSAFTKTGHTLSGYNVCRKSDNKWYVESQGWVTESEIKSGNSKKLYGTNTSWNLNSSWFSTNTTTDTYTFYAVWKANTYTITYNMNGGNGSNFEQIITYGQDVTLSAVVPTRTDYKFVGWNTSRDATTAIYQPGGKYSYTRNVNLYAIWTIDHSYTAKVIAPTCTEKGYTLHTCSNCGDSYKDTYVEAQGHDYEDVIIAPTETEQGYTLHTCSRCGHSYKSDYVDPVPVHLAGDINNDGKVNMKDVTRLHQYINGWNVTVVEAAIDVNGDGKVNMKDVTRLHQYINGWDVKIYVK